MKCCKMNLNQERSFYCLSNSFSFAIGILGSLSFFIIPSSDALAEDSHQEKFLRLQLPQAPKTGASRDFWKIWGDGKAEISGYKGVTSRYGQLRKAEQVFVFVTESMNRKTWIKDESVTGRNKVSVLKLNSMLKFRTGIYPYSVMTSVFTPVDHWRKERFSPVKIAYSGQEWCGHVFQALWPSSDHVLTSIYSYFASEGQQKRVYSTPQSVLYEDALWTQLRELDGSFAKKGNWKGKLVPSLWNLRKSHHLFRTVFATITRQEKKIDTKEVVEFTLSYGGYSKIIQIEKAKPKRILEWRTSSGESMKLQKSTRLPYWSLNKEGDESYLRDIGLSK